VRFSAARPGGDRGAEGGGGGRAAATAAAAGGGESTARLAGVAPREVEWLQMSLTVSKLVLTLEADVGASTVPLIFLDSALELSVSSWSSALQLVGTLSFHVSCYNELFNVWEPLVEPLHCAGSQDDFVPWEMTLSVRQPPLPAASRSHKWLVAGEELQRVRAAGRGRGAAAAQDGRHADLVRNAQHHRLQDLPERAGQAGRREALAERVCFPLPTLNRPFVQAFSAAVKQKKSKKTSMLELSSAFVANNQLGVPVQILPSETLTVQHSLCVCAYARITLHRL